jgi:hypothetical protein
MKVCWPHAASYDFRTSGVKNISVIDKAYALGKCGRQEKVFISTYNTHLEKGKKHDVHLAMCAQLSLHHLLGHVFTPALAPAAPHTKEHVT